MAAIAGIATLAAAAVAAYSAYEQGQTQQKIHTYNRRVAENQAIAARQAAAIEAENKKDEYRRIMASTRTRAGAAGLITSEGSPLLVQMENAETAAWNLARIRYAGETQAKGFEAEGIIEGYKGKAAKRHGTIAAGATLLGGVASAYGGYQTTKSRGSYYDQGT